MAGGAEQVERLVAEITDAARAHAALDGVTVPQRRRVLATRLRAILADEQGGLSPRIRHLIEDLRAEWRELDVRIEAFDAELVATAGQDDACRRLCAIPGIGALNATALVAAVGIGSVFDKGRDMAAWLGLVPREYSTGGKQRLLGISKRGNKAGRADTHQGQEPTAPQTGRIHSGRPLHAIKAKELADRGRAIHFLK